MSADMRRSSCTMPLAAKRSPTGRCRSMIHFLKRLTLKVTLWRDTAEEVRKRTGLWLKSRLDQSVRLESRLPNLFCSCSECSSTPCRFSPDNNEHVQHRGGRSQMDWPSADSQNATSEAQESLSGVEPRNGESQSLEKSNQELNDMFRHTDTRR